MTEFEQLLDRLDVTIDDLALAFAEHPHARVAQEIVSRLTSASYSIASLSRLASDLIGATTDVSKTVEQICLTAEHIERRRKGS